MKYDPAVVTVHYKWTFFRDPYLNVVLRHYPDNGSFEIREKDRRVISFTREEMLRHMNMLEGDNGHNNH